MEATKEVVKENNITTQQEVKTDNPPVENTNTQPEEKKKGNGCLTGCLVVMGIITAIIIIVGILGYISYKKITTGISEEQNLGITYEDAQDLIQDINIEFAHIKTAQPVTITSEQATALINEMLIETDGMAITNTQVKFSEDQFEMTTTLTYNENTLPLYTKGSIQLTSDQELNIDIEEAKAGALEIPSFLKTTLEQQLDETINTQLATLDENFVIKDIQLTNEGLVIDPIVNN